MHKRASLLTPSTKWTEKLLRADKPYFSHVDILFDLIYSVFLINTRVAAWFVLGSFIELNNSQGHNHASLLYQI